MLLKKKKEYVYIKQRTFILRRHVLFYGLLSGGAAWRERVKHLARMTGRSYFSKQNYNLFEIVSKNEYVDRP